MVAVEVAVEAEGEAGAGVGVGVGRGSKASYMCNGGFPLMSVLNLFDT